MGSGRFGTIRTGHRHEGIDLEVVPGQGIIAPVKCFVVRRALPYIDDEFQGLLLRDGPIEFKIFYFTPDIQKIRQEVDKGEPIGVAQDISLRYGPQMTPHVHLEMRVYGVLVDPEKFL